MTALTWTWLEFVTCATLIGAAGYQLSRYGDSIAKQTGLSGSWIGLALLATVTSLPELITGISSVTIANAPNVAVGDALGSCVVNLVFLVVIDFLYRKDPVWLHTSQGHVLAAAFGVVSLGFMLVSLLMSQAIGSGPAGHAISLFGITYISSFSMATPAALLLYLVAMRTVFNYERVNTPQPDNTANLAATKPSLQREVTYFVLAAIVVAAAGLWLPFASVSLAKSMGWSNSFVGSMFVALATSLPELAVTLSAVRLGALDMAIGNLLGSNLFNVAIIAVDDLFYPGRSLLADVSLVHSVTAGSAIVMTGLATVGLFLRPRSQVLRAVAWVSLGLIVAYLLNAYVLYMHGE